ncbi:N-acyl-D-aspartate/D-glutamate deacylase [Actinokineospora alba]|uniref:N-acyl-D-aspartate/D-glutamate deacylase n=1 Tax=Actinokineospora alba TaxID=504798 RepID=A0A1H0JM01_9PSEU|nr:amidohydrolase family protein [Actinokineospora alba]TDP68252.1 N-acyl-D-aspartate/D-glutamate deacylase [Actinokineospora alba]SDH95214.1 N-acyl-D-aspartate/D-glutamate deacylase [Actinokineospora alba]SDO44401.1 N-acyl-D-aspartate/D-glutamate deacylase [Actinokineospora alba]
MTWDSLIRGGRWFDGTGAPSAIRDLGIKDGRVAAVSATPLDATGCANVIDAAGQWVVPGFVDIHTHYDAEVLLAPGLTESVRHGVTTVLIGSCSLGTLHVDALDAADLFSRVEAIPHDCVVKAVEEHKTWSNAAEYVAALESLPLGPNVTSFLGHSDLRAGVMGLDRSTDRKVKPSAAELDRMRDLLEDALAAGFVGLSEMRSPWDKLDGDRYRSRTLPSTYASWKEYRALHRILRREGRVLQSIPNLTTPTSLAPYLLESMGFGLRPALKTSFLTAADVKANPALGHLMGPIAGFTNRVGRGDFRWQHLPVPFDIFADGIDLVVFEELGSGAAALHLKDEARTELMRDEAYRRRFRREYDRKWTPRVWNRDFYDAHILACPDESVVGKTFGQVGDERGLHPVDAFLDLVVEHGTGVRWYTTISNHRPKVLDKLSSLRDVQMGFSDAGAHLRNMAFYNFGLRLLRRAHTSGFMTIERAVHRLTGELADWYDLDAGRIREGDRADLVVIDPAGLDESVDQFSEAPVEVFGNLSRMVNRNDRAVTATLVAGNQVFGAGEFAPPRRTGRFLRAGEPRGTVDPATLRETVGGM